MTLKSLAYFILSILITIPLSGCGPRQNDPSSYYHRLQKLDASRFAAEERGSISLEDFAYDPAYEVIEAAAARLGCERALNWLAYPKTGSMQDTIASLYKTDDVYATLQTDLWAPAETRQRCQQQAHAKDHSVDEDAGFKQLLEHVTKQGKKLAIIIAGGFGSHEVPAHFLKLSEPVWLTAAAQVGKSDQLKVIRFECSDSYQSDDVCAPEFNAFWTKTDRAAKQDTAYLLIGYSKGGSTLIQALGESQVMRDKTLAVLTAGSPIAGAAAVLLPNYLQEQLNLQSGQTGTDLIIEALALTDYLGDMEGEIRKTLEASKHLIPGTRQKYLADVLSNQNYHRSDRSRMQIFHLAGTLDLARLADALPILQRQEDDEKLVVEASHIRRETAIQTLSAPMFADYPLFDSTVSLEHAVIPQQFLPDGADAELLALFRSDHLHFRQTEIHNASTDNPEGMPQVALMDAVLEVISARLKNPKIGGM